MPTYIDGMDVCDGPYTVGDYRDMLRDLVECRDFPRMCLRVGLVPSGPDVQELEHRRHHARIHAITPLIGALNEAAALAGCVIADLRATAGCEHEEVEEDDEEVDPEDAEDEKEYLVQVAQLAATGAVMRLVALGKLRVTPCIPRISM